MAPVTPTTHSCGIRSAVMAAVLVGAAALTSSPTPVNAEASEAPGAPRAATAISISGLQSCAVFDDGAVRCWGYGGAFLGQGPTSAIGDDPGEMAALPPIDLGTGRTATAVAAGQNHTCALLDGGDVVCWGSGAALGDGTGGVVGDDPGEMGDALVPVDLGTGRTATAITAGSDHTCALLDNGDAKCWGGDSNGQLGQGTSSGIGDDPGEMGDSLPPIDLGTGRTATAISASSEHTCALLDNGSLKCWGYGAEGLGQGNSSGIGDDPGEMGDSLPPIDLGTGRTATAITTGTDHNCALLDNGDATCWGGNSNGQLGTEAGDSIGFGPGEMGDALTPIAPPSGRIATAITAGSAHTCALLDDGSIVCWGAGNLGERGDGATLMIGDDPGEMGDGLVPVGLPAGRTGRAVTAAAARTCAVLDDGSLICWGAGGQGNLGTGGTENIGDDPGEVAAVGRIPVTGTVDAAAATVTVVATPSRVLAGRTIRYTATVTNSGYRPLTGVAVSLPGGTCSPAPATLALAATASTTCTLRPTNANAPQLSRAVTVTASNVVLGSSLSVTSNTVTTNITRAVRRPDALVRVGTKPFVGNDVHNRTGKKQTVKATTAKKPVRYTVRVQNDGNVTDTLRIRGARGTKAFTVTYRAGAKNITKTVTQGTYRVRNLAPGASRNITITVTPEKAAKPGAKTSTKVTITSTSDTTQIDTVTVITRRR